MDADIRRKVVFELICGRNSKIFIAFHCDRERISVFIEFSEIMLSHLALLLLLLLS